MSNTFKFPTLITNRLSEKRQTGQNTHSIFFPKVKTPPQNIKQTGKRKSTLYFLPFVIFVQVNFFQEIILLYTLLQKSSTYKSFQRQIPLNSIMYGSPKQ